MQTTLRQRISDHLTQNPSYFKWSPERLAKKYNCKPRTVSNIVKSLYSVKQDYLRNLNN